MKKIRLFVIALCMFMVFSVTSVIAFASSLSIEAAQEYYAGLSGDDVATLQSGYDWSESNRVVTATLKADGTSTVSFWYDELGMIQYNGFFGSSEEESDSSSGGSSGSNILDRGFDQASGFLQVCSDVTNFIVSNELCLITIGFVFVSRSVGCLRRCLRVTPR